MKHVNLYVARSFNDYTDDCRCFYDMKAARSEAVYLYGQLTAAERLTNTVAVEGYPLDLDDDDARSAMELFGDLLNVDDDRIRNPEYYEEITRE